ncbi:hypothetical protein C8J56DRAFT_946105 [Mycena floridula]|nr:hypothetical protein C8J56DRAFT_946105 [Mycena floridula]
MLCSNRFPLPGSPSTCTLDTVIVPLPSFLFLVVAAFVLLRQKQINGTYVHKRWIIIIYYFLIVAAFGMALLEIARLLADNLGMGLLVITPITLLVVICLRQFRDITLPLAVYWLFLAIVELVKTIRMHTLEMKLPNTTKTSKYPSSDQFLDNLVMLILYALLFIFECGTLVKQRRVVKASGGGTA